MAQNGMQLDAVRFCIGPWNGKYSSVWRVWTESDDVYLGVRALLQYLKISLHKSGKFRAAFTSSYNKLLVKEGKDGLIDRAFLKWDVKPVLENQIVQALDIHFPLSTLSLGHRPDTKKGKKLFLLQPDENSLRNNDSVTFKILFHKTHPENKQIDAAFKRKKVMPFFWASLQRDEYLTIAFQYTKQLPLYIPKRTQSGFGPLFYDYFQKRNRKPGDALDNITMQFFRGGSPPAIFNIGGVMVRWEAEKHFSINIGTES